LCDGISNEDEAELAIDHNYHCILCRPVTGAPAPGMTDSEMVWHIVVIVYSSIIHELKVTIVICNVREAKN